MKRIMLMACAGLVLVACGEGRTTADGEEVVPVDMDTLSWFQQGQTVEHAGHRWVMVGPPVYDPLALIRVGDFQGTPLYAERGVASPPSRLYIPVGRDYWQMLERAEGVAPGEAPPEVDIQPGTEGVEP